MVYCKRVTIVKRSSKKETIIMTILRVLSFYTDHPYHSFEQNASFSNERNLVIQDRTIRSSHQRCSLRKGVLRNFAKFTRKHLCQSLFIDKVAGPRSSTLLKNRLWHRCFPVNFAKSLGTPFLQNTFGQLLPDSQFSQSFQTDYL